MSCTGIGDCTAVGSEDTDGPEPFVWTETNGTWGTPTELSDAYSPFYFNAISCIDASDCTAVGPGPVYAAESDGTWGPATALSGPNSYYPGGVSCTGVGDCVAVGGGLPAYWIESGGVWDPQNTVPEPDAGAGLASVSCISSTVCTAFGTGDLDYVTSTLVPGGTMALKKSSALYGKYTRVGVWERMGSHKRHLSGALSVCDGLLHTEFMFILRRSEHPSGHLGQEGGNLQGRHLSAEGRGDRRQWRYLWPGGVRPLLPGGYR